jgi:hypothetical protein
LLKVSTGSFPAIEIIPLLRARAARLCVATSGLDGLGERSGGTPSARQLKSPVRLVAALREVPTVRALMFIRLA